MHLAHKIRLNPTDEQVVYFNKAAGVARLAYNWGLERWTSLLESGHRVSHFSLKKEFNSIKHEQYPFVKEVTKCATEQPFVDLNNAFKRYWDIVGGKIKITTAKKPRKDGKFKGYPKFKTKKRSKPSFYLANDKFTVDNHRIRVPKLGWVNMAEQLRLNGKILSARVSKDGNNWFVSITVEINIDENYCNNLEPVGVDLGIKTLMTLSNGVIAENQRTTLKHSKRLRMLNKKLSRQLEGSNNWWKTVVKLRALHTKINNQRQDHIHKWTSCLTSNYGFIVIEDLNVEGMLKNHKLAKHIADVGFGEIVRQLEYKQNLYGSVVQKINRWFPSSKTCSECGYVKQDLTLDIRTFVCSDCGVIIDRDLNAAINIRNEGLRILNSSPVVALSA